MYISIIQNQDIASVPKVTDTYSWGKEAKACFSYLNSLYQFSKHPNIANIIAVKKRKKLELHLNSQKARLLVIKRRLL